MTRDTGQVLAFLDRMLCIRELPKWQSVTDKSREVVLIGLLIDGPSAVSVGVRSLLRCERLKHNAKGA
jgi:hypothetical protein